MYKLSFRCQTLISHTQRTLAFGSLCLLGLSSSALAQEAKTAPVAEAPKAATTKAAAAPEGEKANGQKESSEATTTTAASATPTDAEIEAARVSFEAGTKAFDEGKFAEATAEFEKAHKTLPSPHAEYWLAVSMDKADADGKNAAEVVAAYTTFLSNSGKSHVGADKVTAAEARVKELKKGLPAKTIFITSPDGATLTIDGKKQEGLTPLQVELTAGTHTVEATLEGYEATSIELSAEGGSTVEQQITLAPLSTPVAAPAPVVEEEQPKSTLVPAAVTLGLAGVGLITGTIFGIMALNSKSKFNDNPNTEDADAAERNSLIADMSFGIAITLGVTGIVLLTANPNTEEAVALKKEPRLLVAPYGGPTGGGAAARLTF